ncbi:MAG: hypothetical protein OXE58_15655, partial [Acidobacteria bacterium]|nr:hypothetical protein [Acidobacteriota bacterium]
MLAAAALTAAAASGAFAQQDPPARIPDPDTAAMEPQVREKIARERRLVENARESGAAWGSLGGAVPAPRRPPWPGTAPPRDPQAAADSRAFSTSRRSRAIFSRTCGSMAAVSGSG